MSGEVIRLGDHNGRRGTGSSGQPDSRGTGPADPTARIPSRTGRGRRPRQPVIPSPEQLRNGTVTRIRSTSPPAAQADEPVLPTTGSDTDPAAGGTRPAGRTAPKGGTGPAGGTPPPGGAGPAGPAPAGEAASASEAGGTDEWDHRVASLLAFLRRRVTGEYAVDEFGFDADLADNVLLPMLRLLYRHWFRIEVTGAEKIPTDGAALLVANHSGTIALDAMMLAVAVHDDHPAHRHLRLLGADFVFRTPLLSELARKSGATLACNPDAERLLNSGELVAVFPEGFKGVGKRFSERYRLQRFGRGGFVAAALRTGAPIIPVSIVGAEETYPLIGDLKPLARLLGLPYFPVTPLFPWLGPLGAVPLPSKWLIEFGDPIHTHDMDVNPDDPMVVFNVADQVREMIQHTLYQVLRRRGGVFG